MRETHIQHGPSNGATYRAFHQGGFNLACTEPVPVSVSSMLRSSGSDLGGILCRSSTQIGASAPTALASSLAFLLMAFLAFTSACMVEHPPSDFH